MVHGSWFMVHNSRFSGQVLRFRQGQRELEFRDEGYQVCGARIWRNALDGCELYRIVSGAIELLHLETSRSWVVV